MIPVSLLLILVAVTLLALGLTSGSSGLLIASIVASLLAAVALVIGARRTAGARRATTGRPAAPEAEPFAGEADLPSPEFAAEFAAAQAAASSPAASAAADDFSAPAEAFAADSGTPAPGGDYPPADYPPADYPPADYPTVEHPVAAADDLDLEDDQAPWPAPEQIYATQPLTEPEAAAATGADYDRASSAIHGARSERPDENAWRRDTHAEATAHADAPGLHEEFGEADADDPDDEPLPQAVQPADAVRVARMDAEVLVVDGRPRYHLADCPHLVGRLTEPIPVNEAIELGFSPCGLCRPVDRLVVAAGRR
jgi:hypothetical protein